MDIHRFLVGADQMASIFPTSIDIETIRMQKEKSCQQTSDHVCLPNLRQYLESVKEVVNI